MKPLLLKDKKGISIMVGYVLLIVLAVGIASAVWAFLNFYVPEERPQCPQDVSLIVSEINCSVGNITMTLENRGLFSVHGSYVKIGDINRTVKDSLCFDGLAGENECNVYFNLEITTEGSQILDNGLKPGERLRKTFSYTRPGLNELEIQPIVFVENNASALCVGSIIQREVQCFE